MQNKYTGDIGDFAKFGLLRALGEGHRLGVAWYLVPDEPDNNDGKIVGYLEDPEKWRDLDEKLFDELRSIVQSGKREVQKIESSKLLANAKFSDKPLSFEGSPSERKRQRAQWFQNVLTDLKECDLVFADPDNSLCEDRIYAMSDRVAWKRMPLSEAHVISAGRTGVIYHHNTRREGGHHAEIQYWLNQLGPDALALYWRGKSPRTFFIVHPTKKIERRAREFAKRWGQRFELFAFQDLQAVCHRQNAKRAADGHNQPAEHKKCPECGHEFRGAGWAGIDAHWNANHASIMLYKSAWPIIQAGRKPSAIVSGEHPDGK